MLAPGRIYVPVKSRPSQVKSITIHYQSQTKPLQFDWNRFAAIIRV